MKPISIVVITYNSQKDISTCLDSIMKINYPKYEVIVVDSSTDKTPEIVKKYKKVKLIKSKKGFAVQRNIGVKNSKYNYIAFIDADCITPKDWLKKLYSSISQQDNIGVVVGNVFPPENTNKLGILISCLGFPAGGAIGIDANINIKNPKSLPTVGLFRKQAIEKVGFFNENFKYGSEDEDLTKRISKSGYKLKCDLNIAIFHKARDNIKDFINWSFRRGRAKLHISKNPINLLLPFKTVIFPFSKKYKLLIRRRRKIKISLLEILTIVNFLFFFRQCLMSLGWIHGFRNSNKK